MTTAKHRPRRQLKLPRAEYLIAITLVFVVALVGWLCVKVVSQERDLRSEQARGDALARQVEDMGGTPVVGPTGAQGEPGGAGASGPPGSPGASGIPGRDGKDGSPGPSGPAGVPGSPGPSGAAGQNGADGQNGQDGQDGTDGADGKDGQTCPDGYSLQPDPEDPDNLVCRRNDASTSPSPTESPSPSPSPSDTSLLPGLLRAGRNEPEESR